MRPISRKRPSVKQQRDKISQLVVYSPFLLMVVLLLLIVISNLTYNAFEFNHNTDFQTRLINQFLEQGVAKESVDNALSLQSQHLIENTQKRTIYGIGIVAINMVLFALFVHIIFRKIITKSLSYQDDFLDEKDKVTQMMEELHYVNEQLSTQLYIDTLTQLQNRLALEKAIFGMKEPKLILLDIDGFKDINEYYGTGVGDYILQEVASELRGFSSKHHMQLFRIGADEFALLEEGELDIERYEELAIELVEIFKGRLIEVPSVKEPVEINVAIGFSLDAQEVFEKAIMALSEAKKREIDYLCYFKKIENTILYADQIKWSLFVKEALANDTVTPYYQPIFNSKGDIVKYECLVRILNEKEEAIPPGLFLSISKKVKRYADIEKVLIDKSFHEIAGTDKMISINLLARDMSDSNISNYIVDKLKEYNVSKQVVFEILEDESIESLDRVTVFIDRVKRMGCKIAIDDFGTGYSNFSYLLKLKPDYIKIDGSLIKALDNDTNSVAIVSAIITFAQKLGIKTIAEYVHNDRVYALCLNLGIDEFQGFYLGEPSARLKD